MKQLIYEDLEEKFIILDLDDLSTVMDKLNKKEDLYYDEFLRVFDSKFIDDANYLADLIKTN